jgi:hypothetical protein
MRQHTDARATTRGRFAHRGRGLLALALSGLAACGARTALEPLDAAAPRVDAGVDAGECVSFCEIRECGPDALCGRSCGTCAAGEVCTALGACVTVAWRAFPSPTTVWLNEVWGSSASDVWIVGGNDLETGSSVVLHFDGRAWRVVPAPTTRALYGVWGFARDDVWAVGGAGALLHFDGIGWRSVPSPETLLLVAVWGASPDDVWASGRDGALAHYDGVSWAHVTVPGSPLDGHASLWGSGSRDVWTTGGPTGGTVSVLARFDGASWAVRERRAIGLSAVWGTSASNVWMAGDSSAILHYDGAAWSAVSVPTGPALYDLWGTAADDVWASGWARMLHFDGAAWTIVATPPTEGLFGVWGSAADDVWAVGKGGAILHYSAAPTP